MNLDGAVLPDPHLANTETCADRKLVESPASPDHLDGQVGGSLLVPENEALVRLDGAFARLAGQGPRAISVELHTSLFGIRVEQPRQEGLDALVMHGRAHELQLSLAIGQPGTRSIAADRDHSLQIVPAHLVQEHALIVVGGVWRRFPHR
jgi:hypothetical protein